MRLKFLKSFNLSSSNLFHSYYPQSPPSTHGMVPTIQGFAGLLNHVYFIMICLLKCLKWTWNLLEFTTSTIPPPSVLIKWSLASKGLIKIDGEKNSVYDIMHVFASGLINCKRPVFPHNRSPLPQNRTIHQIHKHLPDWMIQASNHFPCSNFLWRFSLTVVQRLDYRNLSKWDM